MTPSLRSLRLVLRPYTPSLVTQEQVDWLNDPELMQFSEQRHVVHTLKSQLDYIRNDAHRHAWLINCDSKDIGTITAYTDEFNQIANMGILLGSKAHQGQGFAAEAWLAVMNWLFDNSTHKVEAGCREDNWPMRRLAITTGMTLEAEIPGHFKVGDEHKGAVMYGRFARDIYHSEWEEMWREPYWKPGRNGVK